MRLLLVAILLGGCTMSRPPISDSETDPCSGTITGGQMQTFDTCTATWTTTPDELAEIQIASTFPAGAPLGGFLLTFSYFGEAVAIPLGNMEATFFDGEVDDVTMMPAVPYQAINDPSGVVRGSAEATLTSVMPIGVTDFGAVWNVHGTLTATMKTATATPSSLDVSLTF